MTLTRLNWNKVGGKQRSLLKYWIIKTKEFRNRISKIDGNVRKFYFKLSGARMCLCMCVSLSTSLNRGQLALTNGQMQSKAKNHLKE